jgi:type II secretory pathway component PulF
MLKTGGKVLITVTLLLALYMFPDIKAAYDSLYITAAASRTTFSAFDSIALRVLPLVVAGAIIFGIISAIFRKRSV